MFAGWPPFLLNYHYYSVLGVYRLYLYYLISFTSLNLFRGTVLIFFKRRFLIDKQIISVKFWCSVSVKVSKEMLSKSLWDQAGSIHRLPWNQEEALPAFERVFLLPLKQ